MHPVRRLSVADIKGRTTAYFSTLGASYQYIARQCGFAPAVLSAPEHDKEIDAGEHSQRLDENGAATALLAAPEDIPVSNPLMLASLTFIVKDLLDTRIVRQGVTAEVGNVAVTALPPDRVSTGGDERSQLNVFLYRLTPYTAWRSKGTALVDVKEIQRPPVCLDLHYLVSAYGEHDFHAEMLLGYAMQALIETPILSHDEIVRVLASIAPTPGSALPPAYQAIAAAGAGAYISEVRITPEFLSAEETSKLWSALQAKYRPSLTYKVSATIADIDG